MTDEKTGKRYSGIFNEKKEVLFFDEGIIYPFKGGFSYIHKNARSNTALDINGEIYTTFELSEVYDSFYGYGIYSSYDYNKDFSYLKPELSSTQQIWILVISILLNVGFAIFVIKNDFENENLWYCS
jgi:hypothetical protein